MGQGREQMGTFCKSPGERDPECSGNGWEQWASVECCQKCSGNILGVPGTVGNIPDGAAEHASAATLCERRIPRREQRRALGRLDVPVDVSGDRDRGMTQLATDDMQRDAVTYHVELVAVMQPAKRAKGVEQKRRSCGNRTVL